MKKKFSLWLNIVTICLCVCAVAIGVYAATTATLNVGGKIAFKAHGCTGTVSGTIVGHAAGEGEAAKDGEPTTTPVSLGSAVDLGGTMQLGSRYFSDINDSSDGKPTDIVITLKINNTSAYPIVASMGAVTKPSNVKVTGSDPIKLETGAQNIEFTITLSLEKTGDAYNKIDMPASDDNLTITMDFSKYIAPEFTVNDDGELVTTMGHGTDADYTYSCAQYEEEIEWFAFAVKGEDLSEDQDAYKITVGTDTWYSLAGVDMTGKTLTGKTFWFIQRYVTAGGYCDDTDDYNWFEGQMFDSAGSSNDYDQSDIHEYLSGYAYQAATGITSGMLYDITKREVNETYTTNYNSTAGTQENVFSSRLWLLSEKEVGLLNGAEASYGNTYSEPVKAYGIGNTAGDADGYGAGWWLRSPYPGDAYYAHSVLIGGYLNDNSVDNYSGVRAAFEITIA